MSDPRERHPTAGRDDLAHRSDTTTADSGSASSGDELRELRQVVSLLRGLPDPEPPEHLTERVMERIEEIESRPWYGAFRSGVAPVIGSVLAAGVAGVLFFTALQPAPRESARTFARADAAAPQQGLRVEDSSSDARNPVRRVRRSRAAPLLLVPDPGMQVAAFGQGTPMSAAPNFDPNRRRRESGIDRNLDRQLNRMLLDPNAFLPATRARSRAGSLCLAPGEPRRAARRFQRGRAAPARVPARLRAADLGAVLPGGARRVRIRPLTPADLAGVVARLHGGLASPAARR